MIQIGSVGERPDETQGGDTGMIEYLMAGGGLMIPIMLCSVVAAAHLGTTVESAPQG